MGRGVDISALRSGVRAGRIHWRQHALERMLERGISRAAVIRVLLEGEAIETYEEDHPHPSCLVYHGVPEPLHVVVAWSGKAGICHVITAYRPDLQHFEQDFKTRKRIK